MKNSKLKFYELHTCYSHRLNSQIFKFLLGLFLVVYKIFWIWLQFSLH